MKTRKIRNLDHLLNTILESVEGLIDGSNDEKRVVAISKATDSFVSGLKVKMEYAKLTNSIPHIPTLETKQIENDEKNEF